MRRGAHARSTETRGEALPRRRHPLPARAALEVLARAGAPAGSRSGLLAARRGRGRPARSGQVLAPGPVEPPAAPLLTDVVVAVALHTAGLHDAVLRAEVWPRGVEDDVVAATVTDAQAWLGRTPTAPRLHRDEDGRWVLSADVRSDHAELPPARPVPRAPSSATT